MQDKRDSSNTKSFLAYLLKLDNFLQQLIWQIAVFKNASAFLLRLNHFISEYIKYIFCINS